MATKIITDDRVSVAAVAPVESTSLRVPGFSHGFPSADLVDLAAALLRERAPDRAPGERVQHETAEGPVWRITVAPGLVAVNRRDYARAERTALRAAEGHLERVNAIREELLLEHDLEESERVLEVACAVGDYAAAEAAGDRCDVLANRIAVRDSDGGVAPRVISAWSRKSRARMTRKLAELDYAPLFAAGDLPAMLTLTYPGDWLAVAPTAKTANGHVRAFSLRYKRAWGAPLVGVWKREFQDRGAPHYHILSTPPRRSIPGPDGKPETFQSWLGRVWAEVVGSERCGAPEPVWEFSASAGRRVIVCCEWHRHERAGTGIDYAEGMRARDPKRLAVYFSKHGAYGAKEYQNQAPAEWVEAGSIGRFWGVWGLVPATSEVEVTPEKAFAASRTMRRWQNANGYRVQREVKRKRYSEVLDPTTGELVPRWKWVTRKSGSWSGARMRGSSGFVVVNDGAAFASQLARYLDTVEGDPVRVNRGR